ncbi:(S)-benzoin forming benzil reductase [Paenibacillus allorhizosphaerae]|uniref:Benzil reductase ((S)-benzoin forming) n=1 Tax=Paenibacillus allorhizosphaerae TaxID=2849866 RepID=A0ABN7THM8_9BACL|nr:(S)-benzoin forming benzil reductase [Paenibacillus allorhizosphaerae]CAG7628155.1 Benzil reductase ((S)-benzoin forming) [Paenibacillus allorhizosphaerae]
MHITIITGISRGIGEALAKRLVEPGRTVIGIGRTDHPELARIAGQAGGAYAFYPCDLKRAEAAEGVMERIFGSIEPEQAASITLINNAGMLEPIGPIQDASSGLLAEHVQVNLLAPMILVSAMIRLTAGWTIPRTVVNISSGAGKKPYAGWSAYCATKAGLDMLTRSVGAEQGEVEHAVKLISVAPGVVDTGMQETIRSTPKEKFPEVDRFIGLKQTASMYTPEEAAERIVRLLASGRFTQGDVLDVRQLDV